MARSEVAREGAVPAVGFPGMALARRRPAWFFLAGLVLLAVSVVAGIAFGNVAVPVGETLAILGHRLIGLPAEPTWATASETIVWELRVPRVLTALTVGTGLTLAGVVLQGLLRNPLADPYVLGTASGAALGAAIALLVPVQLAVLGLGLLHVLAFAGALVAVWLVYRLAGGARAGSLTSVLLTGYAVGSLLAAGLSLAMYFSGAHIRQIFFYLLGSFATASWQHIAIGLPIVAAGSALILGRVRPLDALLLGEEAALHLGVDVRRERAILLALASLVTAASVAMAGLIGFVGLVVPHVVRLVVGPSARLVMPLAAVFGAAFLVAADLAARIPGELPVGIITAIVGAPFFLSLLRRFRAGYEL